MQIGLGAGNARAVVRAQGDPATIINLELSIRGVLRNFGLKMGRVAKGRFENRVQELADGNAMLQAAANPILTARRVLRTELAGLETLVRDHAKSDPVCRQFMSMPGEGGDCSADSQIRYR